MGILTGVLYTLVVLVALLLIGLILIQPSKSGGLGATFGGVGESVFGAQAGSHLTKATVILASVFFLFSLLLATLIGHGAGKSSEVRAVDSVLKQEAAAAPAAESVVPAVEAVPAEAAK